MKNRVLTFIIGMLVGALIATGGFFIYSKVATPARGGRPMMGQGGEMGQPPEMPEGMRERGQGGRQLRQSQENVTQTQSAS